MSDLNKDTRLIHLNVYDEKISIKVASDDEQLYRDAATLITQRYNRYAATYKGVKSDHTIALMVLVDIALQLQRQKLRNDTAPYNETLERLTHDIEQALQ
ncbi:MAG: cell division protein ZapA [Prevotella sp.]|nr:cell division protein ZapA [Prevotella sp.]